MSLNAFPPFQYEIRWQVPDESYGDTNSDSVSVTVLATGNRFLYLSSHRVSAQAFKSEKKGKPLAVTMKLKLKLRLHFS